MEEHNATDELETQIVETMNRSSYTGAEVETRTIDVMFERADEEGSLWADDFEHVVSAVANSSRISAVESLKN